jgi:hypothetical protein
MGLKLFFMYIKLQDELFDDDGFSLRARRTRAPARDICRLSRARVLPSHSLSTDKFPLELDVSTIRKRCTDVILIFDV